MMAISYPKGQRSYAKEHEMGLVTVEAIRKDGKKIMCQRPAHQDIIDFVVNLARKVIGNETMYCQWDYDDVSGTYETSCDNSCPFIEGDIADNNVKYCLYCGKPIREAKPVLDELDTDDPKTLYEAMQQIFINET